MKPAFALDFRDNAVGLLHRSGAGWHQVGSVPLEEPDLPAAIGYLRSTALGLSPQGVATKLVIPNDQILYLTVSAPGPDAAARRKQIEAALEGRTPYAVADLAYDWSGKGPEVQVAVIARETLAEAEAFAAEHRFNPMSFVAVPEDGSFGGEPWFGPTALSASLLAPGEKLEKDAQPITLRDRTPPAAPPEAAAEVTEEVTAEPAAPESVPEPVPEPMPEPVAADPVPEEEPEEPVAAAKAEPTAAPKAPQAEPIVAQAEEIIEEPAPVSKPGTRSEPEPEPFETPASELDFDAEPANEPANEPAPKGVAVELPEAAPKDQGFDAPAFEPAPAPTLSVTAARLDPRPSAPAAPPITPEPEDLLSADPEVNPPAPTPDPVEEAAEEAPMALDVPQDDPREEIPAPKPGSVVDPAIADDVPPMPAWTPAMAFSSRRSPDTADKAAPLPPLPSGKPTLRAPVERPAGAKPLAALPLRNEPRSDKAGTGKIGAGKDLAGKEAPAKDGLAKDSKGLRGIGAFVGGTAANAGKKRKAAAASAPVSAPAPRATVAPISKSTVTSQPVRPSSFGIGARSAPQRGKPKYLGLILTAILLVFLAAVAAWSTLLASWDGADATVQVTDAPVLDAAPADTGTEIPAPEDEMLADMQDPADFEQDQGLAADQAPVDAPAPVDTATAEAAPETAVSTDGVAAATPLDEVQDEIFLATMDSPPEARDPLALPQTTAQGDRLPDPQAAPPPFGTVYQFDAQGLIVPTPDGIVTPDGVRLVAGKPPIDPPVRPAELTAASAALATAATAATVDGAGEAPFPSDPALSGFKPKTRPEGLAPPVSAAPEDDASLAPAADSRFASLRPRARPEAVVAAGEEARAASAAASLAETTLAENAVATAADAAISPLAVAISRKPAARPKDMSRAVEAAVAAATREQPAAPEPEPAAQASSGKPSAGDDQLADDEPEHNNAAPSIPTKASVAKQATYKNAINLSQLNLIGVYGTQSNRYALVRQQNGSYKKVKVGDRIDGGKITAITATELRYQKGSRLLTLAMPAG